MATSARIAAVAVLVGACGCAPESGRSAAPGSDEPPARVLLITIDTVRADLLGCYGEERPLTPTLDSIAARGTRFARAAAPMPETAPSHATMLTGRHPLSHGLTDNYLSLSAEVDTLAELLGRAGVEGAAFYHVFPLSDSGVTQGFATQMRDVSPDASALVKRFHEWRAALDPAARAFAWVHLFLAHTPLEPPPELIERFVRPQYRRGYSFSTADMARIFNTPGGIPADQAEAFADYYAADVAHLDARIAGLMAGFGAGGSPAEWNDWLLLVAADHGESLERETIGLHTDVAEQSTLHVPLIAAGPGVARGRVVDALVELADLFPTILEAFGEPPPPVDGESLWPFLRADGASGDPAPEADERVAFGALPTHPLQGNQGGIPKVVSAWQGRFKLVVTDYDGEARSVLFDVESDPGESRDVSADHAEIAAALRRRLDDWIERMRRERTAAGAVSERGRRMLEMLGYGR